MFAEEIKQKARDILCDFYESNEGFVNQLLKFEKNKVITPEKDARPSGTIIISILCGNDYEMQGIIELSKSFGATNYEQMINVLNLNYSPQSLIAQRNKEREKAQQEIESSTYVSPLDDLRQKIIENPTP